MLLSRESGPRENKPVKTMVLNAKQLTLNEYGADRDESVILEIN